MQPEPLFQAFDAGWLIIGGAVLLIGALWWDINRSDEPVHDDEDWDVEPRRHDPEADARNWPF